MRAGRRPFAKAPDHSRKASRPFAKAADRWRRPPTVGEGRRPLAKAPGRSSHAPRPHGPGQARCETSRSPRYAPTMSQAALPAPRPACSALLTHPLELIPLARRWPRSLVRDLVYTAIWNAMIALVFTGLTVLLDAHSPLLAALRVNMVFAQAIGFTIHAIFLVGDRVFRGVHQASMPARFFYYTSVPIVGVFLGYWAGAEILGFSGFLRWMFTLRGFAVVTFLSFLVSAMLLLVMLQRERAARAEAAVAREQARVAAAEQTAATARLKLLEAQVEPHFLFNTLAHVVSLLDTDTARCARHDRAVDRAVAHDRRSAGCARHARRATALAARLPVDPRASHGEAVAVEHRRARGPRGAARSSDAPPAHRGERDRAWSRAEGRWRPHRHPRAPRRCGHPADGARHRARLRRRGGLGPRWHRAAQPARAPGRGLRRSRTAW